MKITNLITETQVQKVILQLQNANGLSIDGIYEPVKIHAIACSGSCLEDMGQEPRLLEGKWEQRKGRKKKQQRKTKRKQKSQKSINSRIGRE